MNKKILIAFFLLLATGVIIQTTNVLLQSKIEALAYWLISPIYWFLLIFLLRKDIYFLEIVDKSVKLLGILVVTINISYVVLFTTGFIENSISFYGFVAYFGMSDVGFFCL